MKTLLRILLLTAALATFTGCAVNKTDIGGFNMISIEQEKQLGDKFSVEIEKKQKVVTDHVVQAYVDSIGNRLLKGAREVSFDYKFKVVQDDSVNAFAIPGGRVYVHTGLMKAAQSESEVAGVMAHEISHAVARHSTRMMTQQYGYSLVLQMLLGQNQGLLTQMASSLVSNAGQMAYSRSMENQADYLAVETMMKTGYDPGALIAFFQKLQVAEKKSPGTLERFFSSHPVTAERIAEVKAEIGTQPQVVRATADQGDFKAVKALLK